MAGPTSQQSQSNQSIDVRLTNLDTDLKKLHSLFEQHFAGVLKQRPQKDYESFKKKVASFSAADFKTTASKFRFQAINARYIQYSQLWEKTLKQIEEGTYQHHLFMLKKKEETGAIPKPEFAKSKSDAPSPKKSLLSEKEVGGLYEKILAASKNPDKLPSKDVFAKNLYQQIERAKEKHPNQSLKIGLKKDPSGSLQLVIGLKK